MGKYFTCCNNRQYFNHHKWKLDYKWEKLLKGINVHGSDPPLTSQVVSEGQYFLIEGDFYDINDNMYVQTSEPVYAFQGIGSGSSEANQGLFCASLKCSSLGDVNNIPVINKIGSIPYDASLIVISKAGADITISDTNNSNSPIGSLIGGASSTMGTVTANPSYVTYSVSGLQGDVSVFSNDELYVKYFNKSGAATSGDFILVLILRAILIQVLVRSTQV